MASLKPQQLIVFLKGMFLSGALMALHTLPAPPHPNATQIGREKCPLGYILKGGPFPGLRAWNNSGKSDQGQFDG